MKERKSCTCEICKDACKTRAGWFLPEQIKKLADNMEITVENLFKTKLAIDWWDGDENSNGENIFIIAPTLKSAKAGAEYPLNPRGECIFYTNGECEIQNKEKPFECREYICGDTNNVIATRHKKIALNWNAKEFQEIIVNLLGRVPSKSLGFGMSDYF